MAEQGDLFFIGCYSRGTYYAKCYGGVGILEMQMDYTRGGYTVYPIGTKILCMPLGQIS